MALSQACVMLKQYGKTPAELRTLRDGFLHFLADIPVGEITRALEMHVNRSDEIPTPKQLRDIIHPPKVAWKPDWAVYVALKRKVREEGYFLYSDEREFLRRCEQYTLDRMKDGDEPTDDEEEARKNALEAKAIAHENEQRRITAEATPESNMVTAETFEGLRRNLESLADPIPVRPVMPVTDQTYFESRFKQDEQPQEPE